MKYKYKIENKSIAVLEKREECHCQIRHFRCFILGCWSLWVKRPVSEWPWKDQLRLVFSVGPRPHLLLRWQSFLWAGCLVSEGIVETSPAELLSSVHREPESQQTDLALQLEKWVSMAGNFRLPHSTVQHIRILNYSSSQIVKCQKNQVKLVSPYHFNIWFFITPTHGNPVCVDLCSTSQF
jgi:hypothetical protein